MLVSPAGIRFLFDCCMQYSMYALCAIPVVLFLRMNTFGIKEKNTPGYNDVWFILILCYINIPNQLFP